jgi:hypothetical protein
MLLAAPAVSESTAATRSDAEIGALDLTAVVTALTEDRARLLYLLSELHRRYPDQVEAPDLTGQPPLGADQVAALKAADDEKLLNRIEELSGEVDRLVARGNALQDQVAAQAGVSRPKPKAAAAPEPEKPYCYKMYGQAYALCASDDRSCKMFAANDYGICKKTGRWP